MILQLVTDRRRLIGDGSLDRAIAGVVTQAQQAMAAGIDLIQIREPDLDGAPLSRLAAAVVRVVRGSSTRVVVNERLDVALAVGADGVHLRASSMGAERVRTIAPAAFIVGRSVHSVAEAALAGPVDYIVAGSVWPTSGKAADHPVIGPAGLAEIVAATPVPVIAIGGIEPSRAGEVAAAGAAGIAAIGTWIGAGTPNAAMSLGERAEAFRRGFVAGKMSGRSNPS